MRPDPRLLLPASAVERVPDGARGWTMRDLDDVGDLLDPVPAGARVIVVGPVSARTSAPHVAVVVFGTVQWIPLDAFAIDLSAPVDGERLDAREWAFSALGFPERCALVRIYGEGRGAWQVRCPVYGPKGYISHLPISWAKGIRIALGDAWPDVSGLSPDESRRAVLVAALVARGAASGPRRLSGELLPSALTDKRRVGR